MNAPGIDKLHDFALPQPPSWAPQTTAWYVVFGIIALLLLWSVVRWTRRWIANRYRREALRELATLSAQDYSALLKRTALAAWPRKSVASLTGESWLKFLDESAAAESFRREPGNRIEELAISGAGVSPEEEEILRQISARWIRRHRVQV
jgi:hypothetical protein